MQTYFVHTLVFSTCVFVCLLIGMLCVSVYICCFVLWQISSTGTCAWSSFDSALLSLWANHSCRAKHTQSSAPNHHTGKRLDNSLFLNLFCLLYHRSPISKSLKHPFIDTTLDMCPLIHIILHILYNYSEDYLKMLIFRPTAQCTF